MTDTLDASPKAIRNRRHRKRQSEGRRVFLVDPIAVDIIDALTLRGKLNPEITVEAALTRILDEWAARNCS